MDLQVLDQNINTGDATGRLLFNMLGAIAQFETEIRAERQQDGIQKAKERGVQFGKQKLSPQQIAELQSRRQQGVLIKTLMKEYDLSKASVYRYLNAATPQRQLELPILPQVRILPKWVVDRQQLLFHQKVILEIWIEFPEETSKSYVCYL